MTVAGIDLVRVNRPARGLNQGKRGLELIAEPVATFEHRR